MNTEAYRELKVLHELSVNPLVTQRHIARRLQVALGLTNLMIRRLIKKGYVKIVNVQRNRIRYLLTPIGITEKTRLTYEFLEYSLSLYRVTRHVLTETLQAVASAGDRRLVLFGATETAEIAFLTMRDFGLELVGVIDEEMAGTKFLGLTVLSLDGMKALEFDRGLVSARYADLADLRERLLAVGIPEHKLLVIEYQGVRAPLVGSWSDRATSVPGVGQKGLVGA